MEMLCLFSKAPSVVEGEQSSFPRLCGGGHSGWVFLAQKTLKPTGTQIRRARHALSPKALAPNAALSGGAGRRQKMLPRACHQWLPLGVNHVKEAKHRSEGELPTSRRAARPLESCELTVVRSLAGSAGAVEAKMKAKTMTSVSQLWDQHWQQIWWHWYLKMQPEVECWGS